MTVLLLSFAILLFVVAAMSIGVLFGRKPIKGSCGGMSSLGMETACDICGGDVNKCDKENQPSVGKMQNNLDHSIDKVPYNQGVKSYSIKNDEVLR